jgi:hypothetical protein
MDNLKLGRNLARGFNSRCGGAYLCDAITLITMTANLKVESSVQINLRLSPISFHTFCKISIQK